MFELTTFLFIPNKIFLMLESLVSFEEIDRRPILMAVWSFVVCNIAVLISSQIPLAVPGTNPGFLSVLFTIIPSVYFLTSLIKREEEIEERLIDHHYRARFWERHEKDILTLLFYFAGLTACFALWSFLLPQSEIFFQAQITEINRIQGIAGITGSLTKQETFMRIFYNNLQVMLFSFIFAFIFGAGAVFIITWNASVLGVYIGQLSSQIWHVPIVSLSFLPHGIPEIAGYVAAGLAGGLLSAAIIRKNSRRVLKTITIDSMLVMILAIALILLGAAVETWIG